MLTFPSRPLGGAAHFFFAVQMSFWIVPVEGVFSFIMQMKPVDEREGGSSHLSAVLLRDDAPFRRRLGVETQRGEDASRRDAFSGSNSLLISSGQETMVAASSLFFNASEEADAGNSGFPE